MSPPTRTSLATQLKSMEERMDSSDFDIRTQVLIDLQKDITLIPTSVPSSSSRRTVDLTYSDDYTENQLVARVLKLVLNDENGEVKNAAVSCLSTMAARSRPAPLTKMLNGLLDGISDGKDEVRDIACLALKAVVTEMPTDINIATLEHVISKVFFTLIKTAPPPDPQLASELLQIATDIFTRFKSAIPASALIQSVSIASLIQILSEARLSIRRRSIPALSALISANPKLFEIKLKDKLIAGLKEKGDTGRIWVAVTAALARGQSVARVGDLISKGGLIEILLAQAKNPEESEAVEGSLVALEVLILRCPTEITSSINTIMNRALELVKYDPNYVELDEDDDVDMDGDDEDDDFEEDAYSDDEDVSWKIRRSAAKVIAAVIGTRNELLVEAYKTAAPVLISRFGEREESVRLEILTAFEALLKQTAAARSADTSSQRNKRKRSQEMDEDEDGLPEDSPAKLLGQIHSQLLQATLKQLSGKSIATKQECFVLLQLADQALEGGLEGEADAVCSAAAGAVHSVNTASSSSLAISALSFLATFFRHHSSRTFTSHLDDLVSGIVKCMKDKLQRVNFDAFAAASALARTLRPKGSASPLASGYSSAIQQLFDATTEVLSDNSVDGEVRERALETLGNLFVYEGDALTKSYTVGLPLIAARLGTESTAATALKVIGRVADSPVCKGKEFENWLLSTLPEMVTALRKSRRTSSRNAEFNCLQSVLRRIGSQKNLPADLANSLVVELKTFVDSPLALSSISLILEFQPSSRAAVEADVLPQVLTSIKTSSLNSTSVDSIVRFFPACVVGQNDKSVQKVVAALVDNLGHKNALPDTTKGAALGYSATAQSIGAMAAACPGSAAGIVTKFASTLKASKSNESDTYLALLSIGEIGRITDLSGHKGLLDKVFEYFDSPSEDIRSGAALAAGNLAVGSPKVLLPVIVKKIEASSTPASRLLSLLALKEVVQHSPNSQLEALADQLWQPLFADTAGSKAATANAGPTGDAGDDGVRNVKAACIGKLTTAAPAKFLPKLQDLLRSTPHDRALVAAAIRYTFIDTSSTYDELIAPVIVDFLSLMQDENLVVQRLALTSLNAAIQNKPHLIVDRLDTLQPLLYVQTKIRQDLLRVVQKGPFKVTEDDGLENRKTAYETMYTLLGTCFAKVDLPTFTDRVLAGLKDANEIKVVCLMLQLRLGQLSPQSVIPRLDETVDALKDIMADVAVKEDTVKQDLERKEDLQRSTLRTAVPLYKMIQPSQAPAFHGFVSGLLSKPEWKDFVNYQA